jgi:hypothetical protein
MALTGELARARLLAPTIRDCLLIHNLADGGDYSLFYQLYGIPDTNETRQFESMMQAFSGMQKTMSDLLEENRLLRQQLKASQSAPIALNSRLQPDNGSTQGIRQLGGVMAIAAPVFDDESDADLIEVKTDEGAGKRASENFLKSLMNLVENKD